MQFRQNALTRLRSPEELDLPVRLARPQGRLVMAVTLVLMTAAGVWAFTGTVSSTLGAPGLLTHAGGSYILQTPVAGQVTEVLAEEGETLSSNAPVLTIRTAEGEERPVNAITGGRVTALLATVGSVVRAGTDIASLERVRDPDEPLVAVLYVPADSAAAGIPEDAEVDLALQSVPREQYGVLRGHVTAVTPAPQTRAQLIGFLGDPGLADHFAAEGDPIAVVVKLERTRTTKSGYSWSTEDGPPFDLASRTPVTGTVRLSGERPVDWLMP